MIKTGKEMTAVQARPSVPAERGEGGFEWPGQGADGVQFCRAFVFAAAHPTEVIAVYMNALCALLYKNYIFQ